MANGNDTNPAPPTPPPNSGSSEPDDIFGFSSFQRQVDELFGGRAQDQPQAPHGQSSNKAAAILAPHVTPTKSCKSKKNAPKANSLGSAIKQRLADKYVSGDSVALNRTLCALDVTLGAVDHAGKGLVAGGGVGSAPAAVGGTLTGALDGAIDCVAPSVAGAATERVADYLGYDGRSAGDWAEVITDMAMGVNDILGAAPNYFRAIAKGESNLTNAFKAAGGATDVKEGTSDIGDMLCDE